jgi:hypothetical protein
VKLEWKRKETGMATLALFRINHRRSFSSTKEGNEKKKIIKNEDYYR